MSEKPNSVPSPADFFGWINQMMTMTATAASAAMPTAPGGQPQASDPLATWRKFNEKNEEALAQYMQKMVATPEFAQVLGRSANNAATYKQMVKQTAKAYLEAADMPSRDDFARLAEQIVMLDAKVDDVNENLVDSLNGVPQLLGRMVSLLETMGNRVASLETQLEKLSQQGPSGVTDKLTALEAKLNQIESKLPAPAIPAELTSPMDNLELPASVTPAKSSRSKKTKIITDLSEPLNTANQGEEAE